MTEQRDIPGGRLRGLRRPARGAQATHMAAMVRAHFGLSDAWVVTVAELQCQVPGCPPVETVALMWDADGTAHRLRVFRRLDDVAADDLPPRWYLPALVATDDDCGCC